MQERCCVARVCPARCDGTGRQAARPARAHPAAAARSADVLIQQRRNSVMSPARQPSLRKLLVDPLRVADVDDQGDEPDRGGAAG
jgi:hypothetical protein